MRQCGLARAILGALLLAASAGGQTPATRPAEPLPTQPAPVSAGLTVPTEEGIQARIAEVKGKEGLEAAAREALIGLYNQALAELKRAKDLAVQAAAYDQAAKQAPAQILQLKAAATQPASRPAVDVPPKMPLSELEARANEYALQLAELKKKSDTLNEALKARGTRQTELPKALAAAKEQLLEARGKLEALKASTEPAETRQARQTELLARRQELEAEIDSLEKETSSFEVRGALLRAQQDYFAREISRLEGTLRTWQEAVARAREAEAKRQLEEARQRLRDAAGKHELVQQIAQANAALAELRTGPKGLIERRKQTSLALADADGRLKGLEASFGKARRMVDEVGLTNAIGLLLRKQRELMPDVADLRRRSAARQAKMDRVKLKLFDLNETAVELSDVEARARQLVDEADPPVPAGQRADVLEAVRTALQHQKDLVSQSIGEYEPHFNELVELDTVEKRLVRRAEEFAAYIDERVLWIRSTDLLGPRDIAPTGQSALWLIDANNWAGTARALGRDAGDRPLPYLLAVVVLAGLLVARRKLAGILRSLNEGVARAYPGSFLVTIWAFLLTVLVAAPPPAAAWFVGWRLAASVFATRFALAVGQALQSAAALWLPLALLREICDERGLAEVHLRWPAGLLKLIRRSLLRATLVGVPLVFLVAAMEFQDVPARRDSLGRLAAIAALVLLAVYLARLFRPSGQIIRETVAGRPASWVFRFRHVWYPMIVAPPLVLAAAAVAGYYYTAIQLSWRLLTEIWLIVGLIVLYSLLIRWIVIARRKLAIKAFERRRRAAPGPQAQRGPEAPPEAEEPRIELAAVDAQTRQLIRYFIATLLVVSVWAVWAEVLPALGIFRHVVLWHITTDGVTRAITLADLFLAILIFIITVVASRNIPGLLEITVLQRLHLEAGGRYAVSSIARYVVSVTGGVLAFYALGVSWAHVQWLVAAMTVGLGFGLQEIFANFVSGLIILFERPIRIGDVVTVGTVTGTVTRIRMRATTITDWDRKELIVPNKEFITGQLVNWTLSDSILRVVIPVGIAYGSDTALAHRLLLEAAENNNRVLDEPKPAAFFLGFGESSLNFELRVYVGGLQDYLLVRHDLHMAIDQAFRQAGVEISFPQHDIHIRSIEAALPLHRIPRPGPRPEEGSRE